MRGWSSLVARRSHKAKVVGSNPAPATIFLLALLAGCAQPTPPPVVTRVTFLQPDIPDSLLLCAGEPDAPTSNMQGAAVGYMILLRAAWLDCSDHLAAVKQALAAPETQK